MVYRIEHYRKVVGPLFHHPIPIGVSKIFRDESCFFYGLDSGVIHGAIGALAYGLWLAMVAKSAAVTKSNALPYKLKMVPAAFNGQVLGANEANLLKEAIERLHECHIVHVSKKVKAGPNGEQMYDFTINAVPPSDGCDYAAVVLPTLVWVSSKVFGYKPPNIERVPQHWDKPRQSNAVIKRANKPKNNGLLRVV